jgi:4-diphosphocytidyl-2-C-methyl-D-erythritol kinase
VRKRIPAGGGLGGGSADAACVLLALRDLFALPVSDADLIACAHGLGTDIPFFVDPVAWRAGQPARPAVVSGLGDRIERVGRMQDAITLIVPGFGCATGAVYRAFDESPTSVCDHARVLGVVAACLERGAVDAGLLFNDLAAAAERVEPRLGELRRALAQTLGTPVHVSGSGSTLFCFGGSGVPISDGFSGRAMGSRLA